MAPASIEDQYKFLISCIRYSNNGKVDFEEVRKECSIISKGAAAKRYERLMKANGIHQSQQGASGDIGGPSSAPTRTKTSAGAGNNKKRKNNPSSETDLNMDDDEDLPNVKTESSNKKVKTERARANVKTEKVKDESTNESHPGFVKAEPGTTASAQDKKMSTSSISNQFDGISDSALLNDFLAFGAPVGGGDAIKVEINEGPNHADPSDLVASSAKNGEFNAPESILIAD